MDICVPIEKVWDGYSVETGIEELPLVGVSLEPKKGKQLCDNGIKGVCNLAIVTAIASDSKDFKWKCRLFGIECRGEKKEKRNCSLWGSGEVKIEKMKVL